MTLSFADPSRVSAQGMEPRCMHHRPAGSGVFAVLAWCAVLVTVGGRQPHVADAAVPVSQPPVYDRLARFAACRVTSDGAVWYSVNEGAFSPLLVADTDCPRGSLGKEPPPVPSWAKPTGPTNALFSAVSLVEKPRSGPIEPLADLAHSAGIPLTYLLGWEWIPANVPVIQAEHALGDDVQVPPADLELARNAWPWFHPTVSVLGAGSERRIEMTRSSGLPSFWGITWNSAGVDLTSDRGAPWGFYCADPTSYKRPARTGSCELAAVEWTGRDLTMAYESGREDAYSTDPDDLRLRAHLEPQAAARYEREIVDAYAAAGQSTPLLLVAQEEAWEFAAFREVDTPILAALYDEAKRDRMTIVTLSRAVERLQCNAPHARVVAFPALATSGRYGAATIDAYDTRIGMTFRSAELQPERVFAYDRETRSQYDRAIPQLAADEMPVLTSSEVGDGTVTLRYRAPIATRYGAAFWADPATLRWGSPNVIPAGRAGAVAFFDLVQGDNVITLGCGGCARAQPFPYAP